LQLDYNTRIAAVVLQKSLRDEFGLTVVEEGIELISLLLSPDEGVQARDISCVLPS
jgi:hypothetical protein